MATELLDVADGRTADGVEPLAAHWIEKDAHARRAAQSHDRKAVWVIHNARLANRIVRCIPWPITRAGFLVFIGSPRPAVLPALARRFERVAYAPDSGHFLPKEEMAEVFGAPDRKDRFIGGIVDEETQTISLWRGDLTPFVVPFAAFPRTAHGVRADWRRFSVCDYGHTLRLGDYEAAADAILYEYDADFRRRLNRKRIATERTLGASIRRLRRQRQLSRRDFPGIDSKTLARIERGEVARPHADTLQRIADRLGVTPEDLGSF